MPGEQSQDLTAQLQDPYRIYGGEVYSPAPAGPNGVEAVGKLFGEGLQAFGNLQDQQAGQRTADAQNKTAGIFQTAQYNANKDLETGQSSGYTGNVPYFLQAVNTSTNNLDKVSNGVSQGRVTQDALNLHVDDAVQSLFQQYPDQRAAIAKMMGDRGYDHFMFRALKDAQDTQTKQASDMQTAETSAYARAASQGIPVQNMSHDDVVQVGQRLLSADSQVALATKAAEIAKSGYELNKEKQQDALKLAGQDGLRGILSGINTEFQSHFDSFAAMISAAGSDADKATYLSSEVGPAAMAALESRRVQAHATATLMGLKPEDQKPIDDTIDNMKNGITSMATGPMSASKQQTDTLQAMKDKFGIDAGRALPLYSTLSAAFGGPQIFQSLMLNNSIPPELVSSITKEISGVNTGTLAESGMHVANLQALLQGTKTVSDMDEATAAKQMPALVTAAKTSAQMIQNGDKLPQTKDAFVHSYGNVVLAADSLHPGFQDLDKLNIAAQSVLDPTARSILLKDAALTGTDGVRARATIFASQAAAVNILETAKQAGAPDAPLSFQKIGYNTSSGHFEVQTDRGAYDATVAQKAKESAGSPAAAGGFRAIDVTPTLPPYSTFKTPDSRLQAKVNIMNMALDHITGTSQYANDIPKNATPLSVATHYASGGSEPFRDAKGAPIVAAQPGGNGTTPDFKAGVETLKESFQQSTTNTSNEAAHPNQSAYQSKVEAAAKAHGIPPSLAVPLVQHESGFDPNADAHIHYPSSHAGGLMQVQPGVMVEHGYKPEDRFDVDKNLEVGMSHLKELYDKFGSWKKALASYGGAGQKGGYSVGTVNALARTVGE